MKRDIIVSIISLGILLSLLTKSKAQPGMPAYRYTLLFSKSGWQYSQPRIESIKEIIHKGITIANAPFGFYFRHDGNLTVFDNIIDDIPDYTTMNNNIEGYQKTYPQTKFFIWVINGTPQYKAATFQRYDGISGAYYINAWQTFSEISPYACDKAFGVNGIGLNAHEMGHVLGASEGDNGISVMSWISSCYYDEKAAKEVLLHMTTVPK